MPMKCPDPEWYVFIEDFNARKIKTFNVFHSLNFLNGCKEMFRKFKNTDDIEREIRSWARYSFWAKREYEIILTCFGTEKARENFNDSKIDVYDQLILNWKSFFEYTMQHKAYFLRRKEK